MNTSNISPKFTKSVGFWMAIVMILSQLINALRAFSDPVSFAVYMGLPLANQLDDGFVEVYGLRALFLGVFATVLVYTKQIRALSLLALFAVIMPIGDVILVWQAGAPASVIVRHVVIGMFLFAAWYFISRWLKTSKASG
jgi:hypothetical protein